MSYCRFAWDGSDVYVYENCEDKIVCSMCQLLDKIDNVEVDTPQEMLAHLKEHINAGHTVPWYAIDALKIQTGELEPTDDLQWAIFLRENERPKEE